MGFIEVLVLIVIVIVIPTIILEVLAIRYLSLKIKRMRAEDRGGRTGK